MKTRLSILILIFSALACQNFLPGNNLNTPSGKIVFQSNQDGNFELYMFDISRSKLIRLTNNSANDFSPTYIELTNQIGFVSDRQNGWHLYTMDIFGQNQEEILSRKDIALDYPDWSADGKLIAISLVEKCTASSTVCIYDIYTMNEDGTNLRNITNTSEPEWVPKWSLDGQKILFASDRDGDSEIYIVNKDGSNLVQLTDNDGHDGSPQWSPDGTRIAFETDRDGGDWDIYIMNEDGSDLQPITTNLTGDFSESWSPDGNWFVYVSNADEDNEIYLIDIKGQNQQRLTNNTFNESAPIWIP